MKNCAVVVLLISLSACGIETVGTAATGAAMKKQELEQAQKTMEQVKQKTGEAMQQLQKQNEQAADAGK